MRNALIKRAAEILRKNSNLKYYQAMAQARSEMNEMDRKTTRRTYEKDR